MIMLWPACFSENSQKANIEFASSSSCVIKRAILAKKIVHCILILHNFLFWLKLVQHDRALYFLIVLTMILLSQGHISGEGHRWNAIAKGCFVLIRFDIIRIIITAVSVFHSSAEAWCHDMP